MTPEPKSLPLTVALISELAKMADPPRRKNFLRKHKLLNPEIVAELASSSLKEMRVDTRRAMALAESALLIARSLRRSDLIAQSYRAKANVVAAAGKYTEAIRLYQSALNHFTKLNDEEGIARTLTALIQPRIMIGEYDRSFEAAERAQRILQKLGDERRLARLENNIGNIYHRQDRFAEALAHYEDAYNRLLPYSDSEELTISLNNMSMCLISMNDFSKALATYERAKVMLRDKDLPLIQLINDYNIAYLYYLRGDYRRGMEMLKASRVSAEKIGYTYLVALCYLDLSDIYIELNLSTEAQDVAEQGNRLFRELTIGYEAAKTLANQAIALGQAGKTGQALERFTAARELFVHEKNEVWPWLIDLYQAIVLFHQGRYFEARRAASGASEFFKASFLKSKAVLSHLLLSQVALRTGDTTQAHSQCSEALTLAQNLDSPILRYQLLFLSGQVEQARGRSAEAYAAYQQAREQIESLRSSLGRDELKISFMKNKTEVYERLIDLCLTGDLAGRSDEEAFSYIEMAKSRSLTELLFQRNHPLLEDASGQSELVHKIRDLRQELNWYQHRIEEEQLRPKENAEQKLQQLHREAQSREKELLAALREIPDGAAGSPVLPVQQHVPLETVRSFLADSQAIIEYFSIGDRIMAAIVTRESLSITPLTTMSEITESLRLLRFQLGKFQMPVPFEAAPEQSYRATLGHLRKLHDALIAPLRSELAAQHLIFVPHGVLHYLPFHALHDGSEFLIDSHTISYAPSASVFALCHLQKSSASSGSLVLGLPDAQAPLIQSEVELVHKTLPGSELHVGDPVTHELLFGQAPNKRLIHIATHGSFRPDNPMFSGIRLSDGYLYLYEIFQLRLSAELVAFSGCGTGLNMIAEGDELVGLIRGAFYAGTRSLLVSLWDVNDRSTTDFMAYFYGAVAAGENFGSAFARATRKLRQEHPHPYYWAPFVLVGKALSSVKLNSFKN